jgi:hypothetical protein
MTFGKMVMHHQRKVKDAALDMSGVLWSKPELDVSAVVLSADAVLAAHGMGREGAPRNAHRKAAFTYKGWRLSAYSRTDGAELWHHDLPAEPLYNGIAVEADRTVLVTLRDGSVICFR